MFRNDDDPASGFASGEAPPRWITLLVLFALFVLLPFLLLGKLVVAGWRAVGRRLGGRS